MAVVDRKRKSGSIVYYVTHRLNGVPIWERVGTSKRAAERRDLAMKREIEAGTYTPGGRPTGQMTVGTFAETWFATRTNRTAKTERGWWDNHVVKRCHWFLALPIADVRHEHVLRLLRELRQPCERMGKGHVGIVKPLGEKSVYNIFTVVGGVFKAARMAEIMERNPCEIPRKQKPTNKARSRRRPYSEAEVEALVSDPRVRADGRMWIALAFYTGMRKGEVCGRRFRDWDRNPRPLGALTLETQYGGVMLKSDVHAIGEQPRMVPVHPMLAEMLDAWWSTGFEMVYCKKPTQDDFIVPRRRSLSNHTGSSAYKMFRRACKVLDVIAHTLHATRNTFISFALRAGARKDILERVTHNAGGAVIDTYIDVDWAPLCEAVACFMAGRPRPRPPLRLLASEPREHVGAAEA